MNTIEIKVDYIGTVTLGKEYKTQAPLVFTWFQNTDITIETEYEKITVNSDCNTTVTPQIPNKNISVIPDVKLKLVHNNLATFLIVNEKYAYRIKDFISVK